MEVRFDRQGLLLDRRRTLIRAAEFHYWRQPARELWADVLLRIRAAGYNAVDVYYHWGFHSPKPNEYRFDGLRDVEYLHQLCEDLGLLLIARPGPYICAETDGGGFPGWLLADGTVPLRCRKGMAPMASITYLHAVQQWFGEIIPRILRCENLIAFQIENEYITETMQDSVGYMEQLYSMVRGFGVSVPLFHNGAWRPGDWQAAVDICGHDAYPFGFDTPYWREDAADALSNLDRLGERLRPACPYSPLFVPELQAGGFDGWGGQGYDTLRASWGRDRLGLIARTVLSQQFTLYTHYMFYGGTNWDFLGSPEVYTSYDYGAPIHETLAVSERYAEAKHLACAAETLTPLLSEGSPSDAVQVDPPDMKFAEVRHDTGLLVCVRNLGADPRTATLNAPPWQMDITLQPGTARLLSLGMVLSPEWRWASNAELFTSLSDRIVFLVSPPEGTTLLLLGRGEILEHDSTIAVQDGEPRRITAPGTGVHRLLLSDEYGEYAFYILDRDAADRAWRSRFEGMDRVVLGPDLFLNDQGDLHAYAAEDRAVSIVDLNTLEPGLPTDDYDIAGPEAAPEPAFGPWTLRRGGTEILPDFDDGDWIDVPDTANPALDQWGIWYGVAWYRTTYAGAAKKLELSARHHASVYLNGRHVQSVDWDPPTNGPDDEPPVTIALPAKAQSAGDNVLVVFVESLGHNKGFVGDDYRNPRGILSATLDGRPLNWRLRPGFVPNTAGDILGADHSLLVDTWDVLQTDVAGPLTLPKGEHVVAFTSTLRAPLPAEHWAPLEIEIDACPGKGFLIVRDTIIGRFWPAKGPQHRFVVPPAWLDANGEMEVTLLVWARGETGPIGPLRAHRTPIQRITTL